jgi:AraC-like DNA-binding protein
LRAHFAPQRQWKQSGPRLREVDFRRVELHIEEHLGTPFSLAAFARAARLSPSYFCRLFKATTGYKPRDYFNRRRVLQAKERLETGKHSVSEVAYDLGIYDLGHFGRLFRKFLHASPRTFLPRQEKQSRSIESQSGQS